MEFCWELNLVSLSSLFNNCFELTRLQVLEVDIVFVFQMDSLCFHTLWIHGEEFLYRDKDNNNIYSVIYY